MEEAAIGRDRAEGMEVGAKDVALVLDDVCDKVEEGNEVVLVGSRVCQGRDGRDKGSVEGPDEGHGERVDVDPKGLGGIKVGAGVDGQVHERCVVDVGNGDLPVRRNRASCLDQVMGLRVLVDHLFRPLVDQRVHDDKRAARERAVREAGHKLGLLLWRGSGARRGTCRLSLSLFPRLCGLSRVRLEPGLELDVCKGVVPDDHRVLEGDADDLALEKDRARLEGAERGEEVGNDVGQRDGADVGGQGAVHLKGDLRDGRDGAKRDLGDHPLPVLCAGLEESLERNGARDVVGEPGRARRVEDDVGERGRVGRQQPSVHRVEHARGHDDGGDEDDVADPERVKDALVPRPVQLEPKLAPGLVCQLDKPKDGAGRRLFPRGRLCARERDNHAGHVKGGLVGDKRGDANGDVIEGGHGEREGRLQAGRDALDERARVGHVDREFPRVLHVVAPLGPVVGEHNEVAHLEVPPVLGTGRLPHNSLQPAAQVLQNKGKLVGVSHSRRPRAKVLQALLGADPAHQRDGAHLVGQKLLHGCSQRHERPCLHPLFKLGHLLPVHVQRPTLPRHPGRERVLVHPVHIAPADVGQRPRLLVRLGLQLRPRHTPLGSRHNRAQRPLGIKHRDHNLQPRAQEKPSRPNHRLVVPHLELGHFHNNVGRQHPVLSKLPQVGRQHHFCLETPQRPRDVGRVSVGGGVDLLFGVGVVLC